MVKWQTEVAHSEEVPHGQMAQREHHHLVPRWIKKEHRQPIHKHEDLAHWEEGPHGEMSYRDLQVVLHW